MGCDGCGKKRKRNLERARKQRDHEALTQLRKLKGSWEFDGAVLRLVRPGDNPMQQERYGDPADAIIYWARGPE